MGSPRTTAGPPSFAQDISKLFTDDDVNHMAYAFNLRNYQDVRDNSAAILDRVKRDASDPKLMPPAPRGPWKKEEIQLFQDWIDGGFQP